MVKKIGDNLGVATSLIFGNVFNATLAVQVYEGSFLEKINENELKKIIINYFL